ncbi:MAG: phosphohistidine phosphatase [Patiriisocius sp.]|jgi:phosphohistidine phosphatase
MKTLHLNRHAKSSWKSNANNDHDRPLNGRGKINAKFMANLFATDNEIDHVISSTAKRAHRTALSFIKELDLASEDFMLSKEVYASSVQDLMNVINNIDNKYNEVMIFAHNPGLENLSNYLDQSFNGALVTCARVKIIFEVESWDAIGRDSGQVVEHDYPRKYPEMANL